VLVDATGNVRLPGFGIASRLRRERPPLTPPEVIAGTFAYMAPEQTGRMNRSVDARSDLYSLGITFYELLAGELPFHAADPMEWIHCHIARQPSPPSARAAGLPAIIDTIVLKLLAKDPEDRYQTAAGLEIDLRRCLTEWDAHRRVSQFALTDFTTCRRSWSSLNDSTDARKRSPLWPARSIASSTAAPPSSCWSPGTRESASRRRSPSSTGAPADRREQHLRALTGHFGRIAVWAENYPENFANRKALIGAETARLEGRDLDAQRLYEDAVRLARAYGFLQNQALANELAGRFYDARGLETIADAYLRNARDGYQRWGALGRIRQLDARYPQLRPRATTGSLATTIDKPLAQLAVETAPASSRSRSVEPQLAITPGR
jgi:hypothetical protein